ncbi:hypothetical protein ANCCAN_07533 [Ancylostoma caninum]|uniref:G-protein coupled receptors family 1 profile domain-containing protein n=1 Tax=Ancylostoma caninum TaxID=29170 RepID=A0A368GTX0_ANCCA|nr:hypothetical protein ANCCAN_07533 [Ancylostoma caninum]
MTSTAEIPPCEPHIFNEIQTNARLFGGMPIAIFGILTNTINIVVFLDQEMRCSLVNHFLLFTIQKHCRESANLQVLSISDLLLLLCNFFMLIFPVIASMSNSVALHDSFPLILWYAYPIGLSTQTCGVYLTVLVSVHRYLGVCQPFRAKRWVSGKPVKCAIIGKFLNTFSLSNSRQGSDRNSPQTCCWQLNPFSSGSIVFSILINIHTWLELSISECLSAEFNISVRSITLTALKSEETYNIITKCILYTLVMFVIPFVTLIIVNWRIIVALKQSTRMRNRLSSQKSTQSTSMINNFRLLKNAKYSEIFGKFGRLGFNPLRSPGISKGGSVRDRSVTLMLLAIVAIFLCCNCLAFCNNIYEIVRDTRAHIENESNSTQSMLAKDTDPSLLDRSQDIFDFSVELSNILISLNSSSSIFVYLVFSSKYRSIIKHCLGLEKRKKINGVAITTAMVAQRALELSFLPDEAEGPTCTVNF